MEFFNPANRCARNGTTPCNTTIPPPVYGAPLFFGASTSQSSLCVSPLLLQDVSMHHLRYRNVTPIIGSFPICQPTKLRETQQAYATPLFRPPPVFIRHPLLLAQKSQACQPRTEVPMIRTQADWQKYIDVQSRIPVPRNHLPEHLHVTGFSSSPFLLGQGEVLIANIALPTSPLHRYLAQEWLTKSEVDIQSLLAEELAVNSVFRLGWNSAKHKNIHLENIAIAARCYTSREPRIYQRFNRDTSSCQNKIENYKFKALYYFLWHLAEMRQKLASVSQSFPIPAEIYRGSSNFLPNLERGQFIRFNHFTSATTKREVAEWYANMQQGYWVIFTFFNVRRVADLAPYSEFPNQGEFLIPPDAQFQVIGIKHEILRGRLGRIVYLAEVDVLPRHR